MQGEFFIGSADWMYRNLSHRVEVVTPVAARSAREKLWEILDVLLRDRRQAWLLNGDGRYTQLSPESSGDGPESLGTHQALIDLTKRRLSQH
jgi:polyphosphate kinase